MCQWIYSPLVTPRPIKHERCLCRLCVSGSWRPEKLLLVRSVTITTLLLIVYALDPFGLSEISTRYSRTLFYQWTAPWYESAYQDDITVVLLRDDSFEGSWPASYALHADVLHGILERQPKSVMVDIAYIDPEREDNTLSDLVEVVDEYNTQKNQYGEAANVPLYLLAIPGIDELPHGIIAELQAAGARPVYGPHGRHENQGTTYQLRQQAVQAWPSAALAVYQAVTQDDSITGWDKDSRMEVTWGLYAGQGNNGHVECNSQSDSILKRINSRLSYFTQDKESRSYDHIMQSCPPFRIIDAGFLLKDTAKSDIAAVNEALRGKIVFYGADLLAVDDDISPPTHHPIPGIFFHAMALDNLLTYEDSFIRDRDTPGLIPGWVEILTLILLVLRAEYVHFIVQGVGKSSEESRNKTQHGENNHSTHHDRNRIAYPLIIVTISLVAGLLIIMTFTLVEFYVFQHPPINFLGLVGLVGLRATPRLIEIAIVWLKRLFPRPDKPVMKEENG